MGIQIQIVQKATPGTASVAEIPQSFKDDFEQLYEMLRTNPDTEGYVSFTDDTEEEEPDATLRKTAKQNEADWKRWAPAYAKSREAGALRYRQLPSKNLPPHHIRFQITADLEENGARNGSEN